MTPKDFPMTVCLLQVLLVESTCGSSPTHSEVFQLFHLFYFSHGVTFIIFPITPYFIYFPHHLVLVYISTLSDRNVPILFSLDILSGKLCLY